MALMRWRPKQRIVVRLNTQPYNTPFERFLTKCAMRRVRSFEPEPILDQPNMRSMTEIVRDQSCRRDAIIAYFVLFMRSVSFRNIEFLATE